MSKIVNIQETCVITKDDKGNLSLVGKAKEVLTSMEKKKVTVNILINEGKKEEVEKFLKDNNVPYSSIITNGEDTNADVTVMPGSKVVTLDNDWSWCLENIVRRLWGEKRKEAPKSEQEQMDSRMDDYIKWAKPRKQGYDVSCG